MTTVASRVSPSGLFAISKSFGEVAAVPFPLSSTAFVPLLEFQFPWLAGPAFMFGGFQVLADSAGGFELESDLVRPDSVILPAGSGAFPAGADITGQVGLYATPLGVIFALPAGFPPGLYIARLRGRIPLLAPPATIRQVVGLTFAI